MDFSIRPISKVCAATGETLEPGSNCWSVLVEENGRTVRIGHGEIREVISC